MAEDIHAYLEALEDIPGTRVFTLRAGSIALGWRLPVYRSHPPSPGAPKR